MAVKYVMNLKCMVKSINVGMKMYFYIFHKVIGEQSIALFFSALREKKDWNISREIGKLKLILKNLFTKYLMGKIYDLLLLNNLKLF